jgi:type I restriction enzyme, S subunit
MWNTATLGEVSSLIKRGIAPKYIEEGGVCVINQKCIRNHVVNLEPARRHNIEARNVNPERYVQIGDVLVNSTGTGTLGRVAQVRTEFEEPTTVDTHVTIVRPKPDVFHPDFFGYMLIKIEDEITSSGEGASGQTELARSTLENNFDVSYPSSLPEQQRIVAILDEAFAGIDAAVAHAEKNLKNARELFESYLNNVFTNKGEGWVEKTIEQCFKVKSGDFLPKKNMITDGEIEVFGGNGPTGIHNECNMAGPNIVIGRVGAKCGNVRSVDQKLWLTDNAFSISVYMQEFDLDFLCEVLRLANLGATANQAAQPVISYKTIKPVTLNFPESVVEQKRIMETFSGLKNETQRLETIYQQKLDALAELKQSILQKAFSGELTQQDVAA